MRAAEGLAYVGDIAQDKLGGDLKWLVTGYAKQPALGSWFATCNSVQEDTGRLTSNRLFRDKYWLGDSRSDQSQHGATLLQIRGALFRHHLPVRVRT